VALQLQHCPAQSSRSCAILEATAESEAEIEASSKFALERYHRAHGNLPNTLDALLPDFIEAETRFLALVARNIDFGRRVHGRALRRMEGIRDPIHPFQILSNPDSPDYPFVICLDLSG
jgi:hypothetical protein